MPAFSCTVRLPILLRSGSRRYFRELSDWTTCTNTLPSRRVPVSRVDNSMRTIPIIARRIAMIGTAKLGAFLCSWINGFPPAEGGTTCRPVSNQAVMMKTIVYSVGSTITMRPSAKIKNR
jgi:hypothetical protein